MLGEGNFAGSNSDALLAVSHSTRTRKHVVCVSWESALAQTRQLVLERADYRVTSILGQEQLDKLRHITDADLLVLGHSVPRNLKQQAIQAFRQHCNAPVLSLLAPNQAKLKEADYGVEASSPADVIQTVKQILEN
jgi:CheY-like chemotaxis protein